jgi:hypothetical protein
MNVFSHGTLGSLILTRMNLVFVAILVGRCCSLTMTSMRVLTLDMRWELGERESVRLGVKRGRGRDLQEGGGGWGRREEFESCGG